MQVVILVFIIILVISFITGLFIIFFENMKKSTGTKVIDNNLDVASTCVDSSISVKNGVNDLVNKKVDDDIEVLGETMVLDLPVIIESLNDIEDIETI